MNLVPGLLLVSAEAALVTAYYFHPPTQAWWHHIGEIKLRLGLIYSALSTLWFGGLLPVLLMQAIPSLRSGFSWKSLPWLLLFWAWRGMEVDLFYQFQGWMFGNEVTWQVILPKVLVDQFVISVFYFGPVSILIYRWIELRSWSGAWAELGITWIQERLLPVLLANAAIWIPAIALIYMLPPALQLPVQNLVLCFWSLLLAILARK
jgi:hypothetical protein